ncbi:MAG: PD-(D/E)XK nuclease family protein [Bacteroidetes Order II. Incertae sedis bacterium]|jgi:hypothetical protein|nr:PD-(D/E)XK nuclease family protein [Bacteroidetes Order II. bacterium]
MIETTTELKKAYDHLVADIDFDKLELGLRNPNIFNILKITKNEIRHSNFLAWLLDPRGSHNLGDLFVRRFLREVFASDLSANLDQIEANELELSGVEIRREWRNIDLLIVHEKVAVCIENKVLSSEHSNQLSRYRSIVEEAFPDRKLSFVYLTPDGDLSEAESEYFTPISYEFIVEQLGRIADTHGSSIESRVETYIKDYINTIKRELMQTDELTELARRIYKNHKEIIDLVHGSKPEPYSDLLPIVKKAITDRDYVIGSPSSYQVRFLTPAINSLIYRHQVRKAWRFGEAFSFAVSLPRKSGFVELKTIIPPGDESYNIELLKRIIQDVEGSSRPQGKQWITQFKLKRRIDYDKVLEMNVAERKAVFEKMLADFAPIIKKVEQAFLESEAELRKTLP